MYHSGRKYKECLNIMLISKRSFYLRPGWDVIARVITSVYICRYIHGGSGPTEGAAYCSNAGLPAGDTVPEVTLAAVSLTLAWHVLVGVS